MGDESKKTTVEETKKTMTTEEAIMEIRSLQLKHNQEIKDMQEKIAINSEETKKISEQTRRITEESTMTWAVMRKDMHDMLNDFLNRKTNTHQDEQSQQLDNNQNGISFPLLSKQTCQDRDISSPITTNESSCIHNNLPEINDNKVQTILMPSTTTAPIFHGYSSERPGQFLNRIKEYTETAHMWGEDMLLRRISQFLKDDALDWYCQLRNYHYLPRSWAEFKQMFIAQFNSPIRRAQRQQQWNECKQSKEETINQFIVRLRALWEEQFPQQTEADLVNHLLCKMRPDMLNIIGCPRNASLQQILLEAQRVEEILYHRTQQGNQANNSNNSTTYNNNNYVNKNKYTNNKTNEYNQPFNNTTNNMSYQRAQRNQVDEQTFPCYNCGRSNHRARDCWYKKEYTSNYSQQPTSYSKNE
jgi:hypothetical protein